MHGGGCGKLGSGKDKALQGAMERDIPLKWGAVGEGGEGLAQVAQRSCGCSIPGNVQGQVRWGFEQTGLLKGVPAHGRGLRTR